MTQGAEKRERRKSLLSAYLKSHSLRSTPERFRILEIIEEMERPFPVAKLHDSMPADFKVTLATVYNTVRLFCSAGILQCCLVGEDGPLYDFYGSGNVYFQCRICGKTQTKAAEDFYSGIALPKCRGFNSLTPCLVATGLCSACNRKENKLKNKSNQKI